MPGLKDLAALPTSWALTMWDALPILLAVETALAVVILAALPPASRGLLWRYSRPGIIGGFVYLLAFNSTLAMPFAVVGMLYLAASQRLLSSHSIDRSPATGAGLRERAWDVLGATAAASAAAAVIKVLAGPYLDASTPIWIGIALAGGLLPIGTLGSAAIPALAIAGAADSAIVGIVWLVAAAVRPFVPRLLQRKEASTAETVAD